MVTSEAEALACPRARLESARARPPSYYLSGQTHCPIFGEAYDERETAAGEETPVEIVDKDRYASLRIKGTAGAFPTMLLRTLSKSRNMACVVATHNETLAAGCDKIVILCEGRLHEVSSGSPRSAGRDGPMPPPGA